MRVTPRLIRRRLVILLMCLLAAIAGLIGRVFYIQTVQSPWLSGKAKQLWSRNIPVQGVRGSILDSSGQPLAYTATALSILAIPSQIKDKVATAKALAPILQMPENVILKKLQRRQLSTYLNPGGRRLSEQVAEKIRSLHLAGIYLTEEGRRVYPYGDLAASVLGITGGDGQGLTGVEKEYDSVLAGKPGAILYYANNKGERMPGEGDDFLSPVNGDDVELTINKSIQEFVQREIERAVAEYNPDHVTAIVANPKTGAILAMANYPTFNPADWRNYPPSTYNHNLAIWQTFEPGSTFKVVTLSAALQENKVNLNDRFYDPGYYEVAGHRIRCWKAGGHGSQSYLNVVENSCNPGFIALGEKLGKNTLFSYIKKFGFGQKTGIDLPGEGTGILFNLKKVGPLELATTAFGQGVSVTPIQQVMALSAVANGGKLMKPYVVQSIINPVTGQVIESTEPTVVRQVISPSVAAEVRSALESVVANGSGGGAYIQGYRVAGKTGTAQVAKNGRYESGHYIVSFIGMAPANNPVLVAYIAIDYPRPKNQPVFGGVIAAPIVGRILADSLAELGVPKSNQGLAKKIRWGDPLTVTLPNFVGLTMKQARDLALQSTAQIRTQVNGQGQYIVAQAPAGGTSVAEGSTVRLILGDTPPAGAIDKTG
ncbi:stage V sporulation protein D [Alicyclobacillus tolerans]|uniref:Stage V sporulation protein D (Sporulation-specific penicillin-binding protein) n=1 Tax=Alicyclobacillus tolerans TaxID=90970 RepID=A0A1M6Q2W8_9BACL|nr:stage V sporulation protein D [Alicyclobacillus montanus]SHK14589.1 stage V sporulation protein D (sporulation-specific penicillin-binding protein) [Alicyclobacillus montanus]